MVGRLLYIVLVGVTILLFVCAVMLHLHKTKTYQSAVLPIIASRNWHGGCIDHPGNFLYHHLPTEMRTMNWLRTPQKNGVIWIRLGSPPYHHGRNKTQIWIDGAIRKACGDKYDLDTFARKWLPYLNGPTVIITTDGDASVPSDMSNDTTHNILSHPHIKAWYTQNYDGTLVHDKLKPIPIGIALNSRWFGLEKTAWSRYQHLRHAKRNCVADNNQRLFRIWCDVHLRPKNKHGNPRLQIRNLLPSLHLVDVPKCRLTEEQVWERYGSYAFVVSVHGLGLDCHRTWEALYLGAVVITQHSSLDTLLLPYRVIFIDEFQQLNDWDWLLSQWKIAIKKPAHKLNRNEWEEYIRKDLLQ